jgi:hypothetical protein
VHNPRWAATNLEIFSPISPLAHASHRRLIDFIITSVAPHAPRADGGRIAKSSPCEEVKTRNDMSSTCSIFLLSLTFVAATASAQELQAVTGSQSYSIRTTGQVPKSVLSYTGTIVNGNCSHAVALVRLLSAGKSSAANLKKNVLRHCQTTASTTAFALLTDDGHFLALDETGNLQVISRWSPTTPTVVDGSGRVIRRPMRASVTGTLQSDRLAVEALSKF